MEASPEAQKKVAKPKKSPARRTAQVVKDAEMEAKHQLQTLYPDPPIPLDHIDSFQLLVAVVLSAQSTDKSVNKVTPALFARAPTPEIMAVTPLEEIQELIRLVGLAPSKAKYLQGLSQQIVEKHGGKVPRTLEELEQLPGVGHKTASVVVSQGFGVPAFPVDTHIHRCAQRWGLTNGHSVEQTEADLMSLIPRERWTAAHLQIIFFGREHCPAQRHDASVCPICCWAGVELKDGPSKASGPKRPSMAAKLAAAAALDPVAEGTGEAEGAEAAPEPKKRKEAAGKKAAAAAAVAAGAVEATAAGAVIDLGAGAAAGKKPAAAAAGGRKKKAGATAPASDEKELAAAAAGTAEAAAGGAGKKGAAAGGRGRKSGASAAASAKKK